MNEAEELAVAEALSQLRQRNSDQETEEGKLTRVSQSKRQKKPRRTDDSPRAEKEPLRTPSSKSDQEVEDEDLSGSGDSEEDSELDDGKGGASAQSNITQRAQEQSHQWRSVLLTATSLVLTKDTRKRLRQLLNVLRLASEHLNGKVNALQQAMEIDADNDNVKPKLSRVAIRNDIITTIKKCLAMLSTLATNSLPTAASNHVRSTLLRLPSKWADQFSSNTISERDGKSESAVLALATETLLSIQNITNTLADSVDRADSWVERFPDFRMRKRRRVEEIEQGANGSSEQSDSDSTHKRILNEIHDENLQSNEPHTASPEHSVAPEMKAPRVEKSG